MKVSRTRVKMQPISKERPSEKLLKKILEAKYKEIRGDGSRFFHRTLFSLHDFLELKSQFFFFSFLFVIYVLEKINK